MTLGEFRVRFPEFVTAPDTYVQAHLDAALLRLDAAVWGTLLDEGQGYLASHMMAITPAGFSAGWSDKEGKSTYWRNYDLLVRTVAGSARVI